MRFQNTEAQKNVPERVQDSDKQIKPYKFSPFQVSFKENKVDYALARLDDLLNFVRRVTD